MMFDDLAQTEKDLIGYVQNACAALAWLSKVQPGATLDPGPVNEEWHRHMNNQNTARVWIQMAGEYLHEDLNRFNDQVLAAHKRRRKRTLAQQSQAEPLGECTDVLDEDD